MHREFTMNTCLRPKQIGMPTGLEVRRVMRYACGSKMVQTGEVRRMGQARLRVEVTGAVRGIMAVVLVVAVVAIADLCARARRDGVARCDGRFARAPATVGAPRTRRHPRRPRRPRERRMHSSALDRRRCTRERDGKVRAQLDYRRLVRHPAYLLMGDDKPGRHLLESRLPGE